MQYWEKTFLEVTHPRPDDRIDSEKKNSVKEFILRMSEYAYHEDMSSRNGLYSNKDRFRINRLYSRAENSIEKYMDILDPLEPIISGSTDEAGNKVFNPGKESKRRGYGNLQYEVLHILPKFKSIYVGRMMKARTSITIKAQDLLSDKEKKKEKNKIWRHKRLMETNPAYKMMSQKAGTPEDEYIPDSKEELEIVYSGKKLDYEEAMQNAIKNDFNQSDWDEIEEELHSDMFDYGISATETVVDKVYDQVRQEYVDVENLIIPYSRFRNYKNVEYGARFVPYTVSEFREANPKIKEEELQELVNGFVNSNGWNTRDTTFEIDDSSVYREGGKCNYDNMLLPILKIYAKAVDVEYDKKAVVEIKGKVRDAELKKGKVFEKDGKYYKRIKNRTEVINVEMVYEGKWLIGTEHVFEYGKMENQIRENKRVKIPLNVYRTNADIINERCQRPVDDIIINELKFQDALSSAAKSGYVFNWESALNTSNEIDGMTPFDLVSLRRRGTGDIFLKFDLEEDYTNIMKKNSSALPFHKMEGGLGEQLKEYMEIWQLKVSQIQSLTGIAAEQAAESPKGDDTAFQARLRAMATDDSLKANYESVIRLKELSAKNHAVRIQLLISYNTEAFASYEKVIGLKQCEAIKELENRGDVPVEWGMDLVAEPTEQEKEEIHQLMLRGVAGGKNGNASLSTADMFMIKELLNNNTSFIEIRKFILLREKQNKKEAEKKEMQMSKGQAQYKEAMDDKSHKREMEIIVAKAKAEIMVKKAEAILEIQKSNDVHDKQKQIMDLEARYDNIVKNLESKLMQENQQKQQSQQNQQNQNSGGG